MDKFDFEKLDVYKKSLEFTGKICDEVARLPYRIQKAIGDNLMRAAISISNKIAEGSGRRGRREKKHFFEISQGSAFECIPMLTLLYQKKYLNEETYKELYADCYAISKMISGLISHFSH